MSSFTSASQHYADYRDMPMVVSDSVAGLYFADDSLAHSMDRYQRLVDENGIKSEEARQVLPNAAAVNILWSVNARSLVNFLEQRLCRRNVEEMQIFAQKIWEEVNDYWPEFADCCGPYCYPSGKCNQGFMSCGHPYTREEK